MGFLKNVMDLLFPPKCPFCRKFLKSGEGSLCKKCVSELPYTTPGDSRNGEFYSVCCSPLYYTGDVRDSIIRFKFKGATNYAKCYGELIAKCIRENLSEKYDVITWVPLSARRQKTRGYDQAMLLAMAAALELGDVAIETLRKPKDVPAQSGLINAESRRANVIDAFEAVDPELINGRRVLLIDDIVTTGSTLSECARVLKTAGAGEVLCACLAMTPEKAMSPA